MLSTIPFSCPTTQHIMNSLLPPSSAPLIKISFFFCKKASIPYADFYAYWRNTHGRLTVASTAFNDIGIAKYVQIINPSTLGHINSQTQISKDLEKMGASEDKKADGWQWDACSELYVRKWDDYVRFTASDEFAKVLGPDGAKFVDLEKGLRVLVGVEDELFMGAKSKL